MNDGKPKPLYYEEFMHLYEEFTRTSDPSWAPSEYLTKFADHIKRARASEKFEPDVDAVQQKTPTLHDALERAKLWSDGYDLYRCPQWRVVMHVLRTEVERLTKERLRAREQIARAFAVFLHTLPDENDVSVGPAMLKFNAAGQLESALWATQEDTARWAEAFLASYASRDQTETGKARDVDSN